MKNQLIEQIQKIKKLSGIKILKETKVTAASSVGRNKYPEAR